MPNIAKDLTEHYGKWQTYQNAFHIWEDPAFVYVSNPKVVCSSTKASLNSFIAPEGFVLSRPAEVHQRKYNPMLQPKEVQGWKLGKYLRGDAATRFTFVRDPMDRLISAYSSKLHRQINSSQRKALYLYLGLDSDYELDLVEFAEIVVADPVARDLDPHWQLQRHRIAFDIIDYTVIGNARSWNADFAAITTRVFGKPVPTFDTRKFGIHVTPPDLHAMASDPKLRQLVRQAYAADYQMLEEIEARGLGVSDWQMRKTG
ncbi:sulfotransferase family 2 domain-containing protein [Algicella marina]|uniref:Sulfotransferase family protein n=1 Tax=Algicella marina TaxID=2683284 RepID=A0A6P1T1E3_9RHOB|nr:sulfotransferase family 2 domain-containing protein [Algicella marina]QHQ35561.1 hypothetical protein GO499_10395 [Algicella marina]